MKDYQAACEDGWKSEKVQANDTDEAADKLEGQLETHLKEVHESQLPADPTERHQAVVDHTSEVAEG